MAAEEIETSQSERIWGNFLTNGTDVTERRDSEGKAVNLEEMRAGKSLSK